VDLLTLDYETYYGDDYTLSQMTTESYVRDPRFEVILAAIKINDSPAFWLLPERFQQFVDEEVNWANTTLLCHHAHFDGLILSHAYNWRPAFWLDTLSMARLVDGPKARNDLESLCVRHGIGQKGDYVRYAKGKHLADFDRNQLAEYGRYSCNDSEKTYQLAQKFLPQMTALQLKLIDLKIRMFTEPVFRGNKPLLEEAVSSERARKAALLEVLGIDKKVFSSNDQFANLLRRAEVEVPMKASPTSGELIPAFAKTDPGMQELLEHEEELVRHLAETRLAVKSNIIETRAERYLNCARRGAMPVYIKPYGTHTQRASAGDGMNWMNLTSVNKLRPEMTVIKRSIEAPIGCLIVSADSSQIQARLGNWLAGQDDEVQAFAEGRDVYSEFASIIYGRPVDRKQHPVDDFVAGQVGKISQLSFIFQKGWYGAAVDFLKGHLGAPPIQFSMADAATMQIDISRFCNNPKKVELVDKMPSRLDLNDRLVHCAVTEGIVQMWRASHAKIAKQGGLWDTMEGVINAMIRGEEVRFGPRGFLYTEKEAIIAPSGARLNYSGLQRSDQGRATYWDGRARVDIYGGSLTNNVVQLLEQEIVGAQMLKIHEAGYKVAVECYDGIVCVVPEEAAQQCLQFMLATMKTRPAWGQDLPITAEGSIGKTWFEAK
jgi:DNA polymerase